MNKSDRISGQAASLDRDVLEGLWLPFTPNRQFKANP
jgi:hypothetical protein